MNGGYSNFSPYGMQSFQPYGRPDFGGQPQQMGYQPQGYPPMGFQPTSMEAPSKLLAPGSPPFTGQTPPPPDLPPGMGIGRPMIVTPQPYNPYGQGPSNPGGPSVPSPQTPTGPTTPASPISDQESNDNFRHFNALQSFQMNGVPLPSWFDMTRANAHLSNWANNPNNPANFIKQGR